MKRLLLIVSIFLISNLLFSQETITYKNHYEVQLIDIENEELAKIAIGHLRKISSTVRCDFNDNNDTFIIKTNTKLSQPYLIDELTKYNYTLSNYSIIKED